MKHDGIHIWNIALDGTDAQEKYRTVLAVEEVARSERFVALLHRNRFLAGRIALRRIIGRYLQIPSASVVLANNKFGKPFVPGSSLRFNLSHSDNRAVLAVTWGREIGVDIERTRNTDDLDALARFYFAPREYSAFLASPDTQRRAAFYHYWTWKEAYIKARGEGMSIPLNSFVVPTPRRTGTLEASEDSLQETRWQFCSFDGGPGFAAAVAAESGSMDLQLFHF